MDPTRKTFSAVPGVPEGWELARVGIPQVGEHYLLSPNEPPAPMEDSDNYSLVVRAIVVPTKRWVTARAASLPARAVTHRYARFRDRNNEAWVYGYLTEYRRQIFKWRDTNGTWWKYCEVEA